MGEYPILEGYSANFQQLSMRPFDLRSKGCQQPLQKKDTSVTFWAERNFFCHTYDTSMMIIVTKLGIIIDVVGSYFYDKNL